MKCVKAKAFLIAAMLSLPFMKEAGAQDCLPALGEAGEARLAAKYCGQLDKEGVEKLAKFIAELPKLDVKALRADVAKKFPEELLNAVKAEAEAKYAAYKIGETISVVTRRKSYVGAFGGMVDGKMLVGNQLIPTIDLTQENLDKANPKRIEELRREHLRIYFYDRKAAYMLEAKNELYVERLAKLDRFFKNLVLAHRKAKLKSADELIERIDSVAQEATGAAPQAASQETPLPQTPETAADTHVN
jgi:hypothetical protein